MPKIRPYYLTLPAGIALACGGAALMMVGNSPHVETVPIKEAEVRHTVTPEMETATAKESTKLVKTFEVEDSEGKKVTIGAHEAKRPQFVYFVLDGCPCSFDAEPLFHKLHKRYEGKIDFVSVTDAKKDKAHEWSVQMLVNYPVVPDPEKKIIHAYEAKSSVYSALISKDGHIVKMWPGYSASLLQEMNAEFAKAAGVPEVPFDPEYAPKEKATGCAF